MEQIKLKDSGVQWIGKIPEEWDVIKTKYVTSKIYAGGTPDTSVLEYWENGDVPWLPSGMLQDCVIIEPNDFITKKGLKESSAKLIPSDTTLIAMTGATCANVGYLTFESSANQSVTAFIKNEKLHSKYLYYSLIAAKKEILLSQTGGAQTGINVNDCKNINILNFNIFEQQKIAEFLDDKCGNIDEIIKETEEQIETIEKYKKSLITEVVTKGLNPTAPMKDSGIEWLGQIPIGFTTIAIKRVTSILTCGVAATPEYVNEDEGILFLSAQNIQNDKLDLTKSSYITKELHKQLSKYKQVKKDDILQVRVGATIGKTAVVDIDRDVSVYVSLTHIRANEKIYSKYLNYSLNTSMFKDVAFLDIDFAGTQGNLNVSDLKEIKIVLPPKEEQQEIVDYLDKKCAVIDETLEDKKKAIETLKQYKSSLIYEYVTGKKRV